MFLVKITLKYDCCTYPVHLHLVPPRTLLHPAVNHCPVCQNRGETLVLQNHWNPRKSLPEYSKKSVHIVRRLGGTAVQIHRIAHHEADDCIFLRQRFKIIYYLCGWYRLQGGCEYKQRVTLGNPHPLASIVDTDYPVHGAKITFIMKQLLQEIKKKLKKLEKKHRLIVTDEEKGTELFSFAYSRRLYITTAAVAVVIIIVGTYLLTSRTFLKHTIPGYPSQATKEAAIDNLLKIDSLEKVIDTWAFQIANIQRVVTGLDPLPLDTTASGVRAETADTLAYAREDSLLRAMIQNEERFVPTGGHRSITQIEGTHFYPPVKGVVTEEYNPAIGHPFIDIASPANTTVCSVLDGTVISAGWNDETGYSLYIQHPNDIISVYKHNEKLLKKTGDKVTAGSPVALVGNTGSLSTGAHLHFELWHKGEAINPEQYITF